MRDPKIMIDGIIQEFAEEMPTLVIQKLGEIRKMLSPEQRGNTPSNAQKEITESIVSIAQKHRVSVIGVVLLPESKNVTSVCHMIDCSEKSIGESLMQLPHVQTDLVEEFNKDMPGFGMKFAMTQLMQNKITPEGLDGILGGILSKDG